MSVKAIFCGLVLALGSTVLNAQQPASPDMINPLYQKQWVKLDSEGTLRGKVLLIESNGQLSGRIDNRVVLSRDGKIIYESKSGSGGIFEIKGVTPGTYALQAIGEYTFAANAIHVLPAQAAHLPDSIDVYTSTMGPQIMQILRGTSVPMDLAVGQDKYYRDFTSDPLVAVRQFNAGHKVTLQNGTLVGRVSRPGWTFAEQDLSGCVARIYQAGKMVAEARVGRDGFYSFKNVVPGVYDLVVSGVDGFSVMKFEAVSDAVALPAQTSVSRNSVRLVSANLQSNSVLNSELVSPSEMVVVEEVVEVVEVVEEQPEMIGGFGGGGGGFGGGGFGGGGVGGGAGGGVGGIAGLAGVAGLAVGVAALANNDDPTPPSIILPGP